MVGKNNAANGSKAVPRKNPVAPPKPPPPARTASNKCREDSVSSLSSSSSSDMSSLLSISNNVSGQKNKGNKPFLCSLCHSGFQTQLQWETHLKTHQMQQSPKFKQKMANKDISSKTGDINHVIASPQKVKKRIFSRLNEEKNVENKDENNKRKKRKYECEYCYKKYYHQKSYLKHYNNHMINDLQNKCKLCGKQHKNQHELKQHVSEYEGGLVVCDGNIMYQCCQCMMKFEDKHELLKHLKFLHSMDENMNNKNNQNIVRRNVQYTIPRHLQTLKVGKYVCPKCEKCFSNEIDLNTHIHNNLLLYKCTN